MLLAKKEKKPITSKHVSFRLDIEMMDEFRTLCKQHNIQQTTVVGNAIKQAIEEMKGLNNAK